MQLTDAGFPSEPGRRTARRPTGRPAALAAVALTIASVAPVAWLEAQPHEESEVAAIFAPWMTGEDAFGRVIAAGGLPVRSGVTDTILVVHSDRPGLIDHLYAAGAWAVIDPVAFGGCLVKRL